MEGVVLEEGLAPEPLLAFSACVTALLTEPENTDVGLEGVLSLPDSLEIRLTFATGADAWAVSAGAASVATAVFLPFFSAIYAILVYAWGGNGFSGRPGARWGAHACRVGCRVNASGRNAGRAGKSDAAGHARKAGSARENWRILPLRRAVPAGRRRFGMGCRPRSARQAHRRAFVRACSLRGRGDPLCRRDA